MALPSSTSESLTVANRRPLKVRSAAWSVPIARALVRAGLTPNGISVLGIAFSLVGGALFVLGADAESSAVRAGTLVGAAVCVQLRLLCNLFDGLVAIECGLKSKLGDLYNEVPDRIEDTALLLGAGFAAAGAWGITLGWIASLLAIGTAYIRTLGASLGFPADFCGPGAKQQRMALLTVAALAAAVQSLVDGRTTLLAIGLMTIVAVTAFTVVRRLWRLAHALQQR